MSPSNGSPYKGRQHYRDTRGSALRIPMQGRDADTHNRAARHERASLAARAVLESMRSRWVLGGCISAPGCLGALLSKDNAFPARVRPNRHHRRRFPADRAPERRGWFPSSTGENEYFRDGAPAVITVLRL